MPSDCGCRDGNRSLVSISRGIFRSKARQTSRAGALIGARDIEFEGSKRVRSLQAKRGRARDMATNTGTNPIFQRYTTIPEETKRAPTVLTDPLSCWW